MLRLVRIDHGLMVAVATYAGAVSASGIRGLLDAGVALASLAGLLVEAGVFAFNDLFNLEEDRVNAPDRPLVRGEVSLAEAKALGVTTIALGMIIAAFVNVWAFTLVLVAVAVSMAYNARLKKVGPLGNLIVAFATALPFIYGSIVVAKHWAAVPLRSWAFFAMAFLAAYGREVIKGIRDIEGDLRAGVKTYAVLYGQATAAKVAAVPILLAVGLSFPAALWVPNFLPYLAIVLVADLALLYSAILVLVKANVHAAERARKLSLLGMGLGIAAFLAGSLR